MQSMEFSNTSKSSSELEDKLFRFSTGETIKLLFADGVTEPSLLPYDMFDSQDTELEGGVGSEGTTTVRGLFCKDTCKAVR